MAVDAGFYHGDEVWRLLCCLSSSDERSGSTDFELSGREARHCAVCNGEDHEQSSEGVHSVYSVLQWTEERSEGLLLRLCHHLQEWQATN